MEQIHIEINNRLYSFYRSVYLPVESNMYVFVENDECIIIDTNISNEVLQVLDERGVRKVHLLLTHEHYDHSHGISWLKEHFDVTLYCHTKCSEGLSTKKRSTPRLVALVIAAKDKESGEDNYAKFKDEYTDYCHQADVAFDDEMTASIGNHTIHCIHAPGHSPGSAIYVMDENLVFTGDSMIQSNKVITSFRGGSKDEFFEVTLPLLQSFNDDMIIMPGHGKWFKKKQFNFNIYNV